MTIEFMNRAGDPDWEAWVATRPEIVQDMARQFPGGTCFTNNDGSKLWVIGYNENGSLELTPVSPWEDYEGAVAAERQYMHVGCVRKMIADAFPQEPVE